MSALPTTGREWHLTARPGGWPTPADFALREVPVSEPAEGRILVRNLYFSVDPYMRGRMNDVKSYTPPFQLDKPMDGGAVGEVIASNADGFAVGDHVLHGLGWREYAQVAGRARHQGGPLGRPALRLPRRARYDGPHRLRRSLRRRRLQRGRDGLRLRRPCGTVGSQVGQMARIKGAARVIGSAGSEEKVRHLVEDLGFDAAFNYKDGPVAEQLRKAAPDGIDVYFDNVGGEHLEAAISSFNVHGRATICGMISQYNNTEAAPAPRNLALVIGKRLRLQGMLVGDHAALQPQFVKDVAGWIASGELKYQETVVEGVEQGVEAFLGLLRGENTGKMIVAVNQ